ncbi:MAG: VanZ family protein [Bacilli bacterium]|nr:VanZ family protein [Bacilli bacterium]
MTTGKKVFLCIYIFLILFWGGAIYYLSSMNSSNSNSSSTGIIGVFVEDSVKITNKAGLSNSKPSESKIDKVSRLLNAPLRKVMHATVYFVLSIMIILFINVMQKKKRYFMALLISVLICFIFACTDEFHQTFVGGRTGQFKDVLIDTSGAIVGGLIYGTYFVSYKLGTKTKKY